MDHTRLGFEKPIIELERKIQELKSFTSGEKIDLSSEIEKLQEKLERVKKEVYHNLGAWQKIQIARHPQRPYSLDYVSLIMSDFIEFHGDRLFGDDKALIAGLATLNSKKIMLIGHQKGRDTKENLVRNFGCANPEGYRKALRMMKLAEKFDVPIVCFIDTPGAFPGIGAEERGQAHAIALNLKEMSCIKVPIIVFVIGEGGSGGALGIGVGDRVCVLENAYYSVISPEGCAAILWKDSSKAPEAAEELNLTADKLLKLGIIDEIIPEPLGGAHKDPQKTALAIKETLLRHIKELSHLSREKLVTSRYERYRKIGVFENRAH